MHAAGLRRRWDLLADRYFPGRTPPVTLRLSTRMTSTAGAWYPSRGEVAVAARFVDMWPDEVDALLLHEMAHVATGAGHDAAFRREWRRLLLDGAPVPSDYRAFRHCPPFAPPASRRFVYACPACGEEFRRVRAFRGGRWCRSCEGAARRRGEPPFDPARRLVKVS